MKQYYDIRTYKQYDRDVKLAVRRGLDMQQLLAVVDMLRKDEPLPPTIWTTTATGTNEKEDTTMMNKIKKIGSPVKDDNKITSTFWTSDEASSGSAYVVMLAFYNTTAIAWFNEASKSANNYVLACLEF